MRLLRPVLLALLALLLVPLTATSAPAATNGTITGVALGPDGKPLPVVRWEVHYKENGAWETYQFGPKLTDEKGRFSHSVPLGGEYRVCFYDDNYQHNPSYNGPWQPEVRLRDTCWPNATSVGSATSWTPTSSSPSKTFSVTLPKQGLGMAPGHPFWLGSFKIGEPITIIGQEGWRPTNATFTYQWWSHEDGALPAPIAGATQATFTPTSAQNGAWIWAEVTASRAGYKPAKLTTPSTVVGGSVHAVPTSPLTITGNRKVGSTLTASFGKPAHSYSTIEWFVDGVAQPAAQTDNQATSTFTIAPAHAGARIDARMSMYLTEPAGEHEGGYIKGSDSYHRVQVQVEGARPTQALAVAPKVTGKSIVGKVLTAPATGGLTADPSATVRYQWLRGSAAISGATKRQYTVRAADVNKSLRVRVTVSRAGWWNPYVSTSTATVAKRPLKVGTVKITGTPKVGKKLTAKTAKWGPKPVKIRYQWLRNGKKIKGATKATYKLRKADRKKKIKVRVTVSKPKYLTVVKTSTGRKIKR